MHKVAAGAANPKSRRQVGSAVLLGASAGGAKRNAEWSASNGKSATIAPGACAQDGVTTKPRRRQRAGAARRSASSIPVHCAGGPLTLHIPEPIHCLDSMIEIPLPPVCKCSQLELNCNFLPARSRGSENVQSSMSKYSYEHQHEQELMTRCCLRHISRRSAVDPRVSPAAPRSIRLWQMRWGGWRRPGPT